MISFRFPMRLLVLSGVTAAGLAVGLQAAAQDEPPNVKAFKDAMTQMNESLAAPMSGNPDQDFVALMIALRQGTMKIGQMELRYTTDRDMRSMANDLIKQAQDEIKDLQKWQAKHPK